MTNSYHAGAVDCLMRLRSETSTGEFGYKIQAIAAHVLVTLSHRVVEVNNSGHPDIVSHKDGREFRFEVEAEVTGSRKHMLTRSDFEGLIGAGIFGYFAFSGELSATVLGVGTRTSARATEFACGERSLESPKRQVLFFGLDARVPVADRSVV